MPEVDWSPQSITFIEVDLVWRSSPLLYVVGRAGNQTKVDLDRSIQKMHLSKFETVIGKI